MTQAEVTSAGLPSSRALGGINNHPRIERYPKDGIEVWYWPDGREDVCCLACGSDNVERELCDACDGEGYWEPYEDNPNEYEPGERETCPRCNGNRGWWICYSCPAPAPKEQAAQAS